MRINTVQTVVVNVQLQATFERAKTFHALDRAVPVIGTRIQSSLIQSSLNFLANQFLFVTLLPKYLNCATFSKHQLSIFTS
jgi:hypothetical protein